jgi:hypothetical protein
MKHGDVRKMRDVPIPDEIHLSIREIGWYLFRMMFCLDADRHNCIIWAVRSVLQKYDDDYWIVDLQRV